MFELGSIHRFIENLFHLISTVCMPYKLSTKTVTPRKPLFCSRHCPPEPEEIRDIGYSWMASSALRRVHCDV